ncbi:hypothetical protein ENBRE01_2006 [Enteropsectra breve]|nr:hypothetical protein ENBRE01_2006 [Enteropsectra breve]
MEDNDGTTLPMTDAMYKHCSAIITKVKRNKDVFPFLEPVDPVALDIPDYPEKIKNPMDISTIRRKLDAGKYRTVEDFNSDFKLMFSNCYVYNGEGTPVYEMGKSVERAYDTLYSDTFSGTRRKAEAQTKASKKPLAKGSMSNEDYSFCSDVLSELMKNKNNSFNWPFMIPVAPGDVPGYFDVIKKPMDLTTLKERLFSKTCYGSKAEFLSDLNLIVKNCRTFNPEGTDVYNCGEELNEAIQGLVGGDKDLDGRITALRKKIAGLTAELQSLEGQANTKKRIYSLSERERIGKAINGLSAADVEKIADIAQRSCVYEYIDHDEIELNLYTIPDEVISEFDSCLQGMQNMPSPAQDPVRDPVEEEALNE